MKTNAQPEIAITCSLRRGEGHRSNKFGRIFLFIIVIVAALVWVLYTSPERFREYDKANQAQDEQNAEKLHDQETAPTVVPR